MPNETIIAKETEKNKRCTRYCSNDSSSASLALIASYSPLNARLDALLSPVSYRRSSGAVSSHGAERRGQRSSSVGVVNMIFNFAKIKCVQQSISLAKQGLNKASNQSFARPSMLNIGSMS